MARLMLETKFRPCYVFLGKSRSKQKALFHCWVEDRRVIPPSPLVGGHTGGTIAATFGLVETEDGSVHEAYPSNIQFVDKKIEEYAFPEEVNDEIPS